MVRSTWKNTTEVLWEVPAQMWGENHSRLLNGIHRALPVVKTWLPDLGVNKQWVRHSPYPQGTWSHDYSLWENKPTAWMSIKKRHEFRDEYFEPWKEGNSIDDWKESEMSSWRKVQFHLRLCRMVGTVLVTAEDCLLPLILLGRAISSREGGRGKCQAL